MCPVSREKRMRKIVLGMAALAGLGIASAHAADKVTLQLKWVT